MTGKPVIKAFSIKNTRRCTAGPSKPCRLHPLETRAQEEPANLLTGPWFPQSAAHSSFAGGIGPENLRSAIGTLHPWAVDLSSSLETDGRKDRAKIQQIARMLKQINTLEAYRKEREADLE